MKDKSSNTADTSNYFLLETSNGLLNAVGSTQILAYPNPFGSLLNVEIKQPSLVNIFLIDLQGRVLLQTNEPTIDARDIPNGVYFLKVETTQGVYLQKVVKN